MVLASDWGQAGLIGCSPGEGFDDLSDVGKHTLERGPQHDQGLKLWRWRKEQKGGQVGKG